MIRRPVPRRRAPAPVAVALLAVLVLGASACNAVGPIGRAPAATVDGTDIPVQKVLDLLAAQRRDAAIEVRLAKDNKQAAPSLPNLLGDAPGSWSTPQFASSLRPLIEMVVLNHELARRGRKVTKAETDAARADLASRLAPASTTGAAPDPAAGVAALNKRDHALVDEFVGLTAAQMALADALAAAPGGAADRERQLQAAYEQQKASLTQACLGVIVARTQAAASAARKRVDAGQPFATVAKQTSIDSTAATGGDAGCGLLSQISSNLGLTPGVVPPSGTVIGPLSLQGAFVVVQLRTVTVPTYAQARSTVSSAVGPPGTAAAAAMLPKLLAAAHVTVDPRYGSWNPVRAAVDPPVDPTAAPTTTTTPGAPAG